MMFVVLVTTGLCLRLKGKSFPGQSVMPCWCRPESKEGKELLFFSESLLGPWKKKNGRQKADVVKRESFQPFWLLIIKFKFIITCFKWQSPHSHLLPLGLSPYSSPIVSLPPFLKNTIFMFLFLTHCPGKDLNRVHFYTPLLRPVPGIVSTT